MGEHAEERAHESPVVSVCTHARVSLTCRRRMRQRADDQLEVDEVVPEGWPIGESNPAASSQTGGGLPSMGHERECSQERSCLLPTGRRVLRRSTCLQTWQQPRARCHVAAVVWHAVPHERAGGPTHRSGKRCDPRGRHPAGAGKLANGPSTARRRLAGHKDAVALRRDSKVRSAPRSARACTIASHFCKASSRAGVARAPAGG